MEQDFIKKEIKLIDRWAQYVVNHTWVKTVVFITAFFEATISPLLPEIVVAGILTYRKDISWKLLSVVSALGSTLGVTTLYIVGKYLYKSYQAFFDSIFNGETIASYTTAILNQNTFTTLFLASFTPLPDRIFALLSGVFLLPLGIVVTAFFCGRLLRVSIVAYFSHKFGAEAKHYILKHTRNVTIGIITVVLLYVLLKINGIL